MLRTGALLGQIGSINLSLSEDWGGGTFLTRESMLRQDRGQRWKQALDVLFVKGPKKHNNRRQRQHTKCRGMVHDGSVTVGKYTSAHNASTNNKTKMTPKINNPQYQFHMYNIREKEVVK